MMTTERIRDLGYTGNLFALSRPEVQQDGDHIVYKSPEGYSTEIAATCMINFQMSKSDLNMMMTSTVAYEGDEPTPRERMELTEEGYAKLGRNMKLDLGMYLT